MIISLRHLVLIYLFCLITCNLKASNEPLEVSGTTAIYQLNEYLKLAEGKDINVKANPFPLTKIKNLIYRSYEDWKGAFEPEKVYWGQLSLVNNCKDALAHELWVLEFSLTLTHIEAFVVGDNQIIRKGITGAFIPPEDRSYLPKIRKNAIALSLPKNKQVTIFFKAQSQRSKGSPNFELSLQERSNYTQTIRKEDKWDNMYIGFAFMLFIYNLILFFFVKDISYIYYSTYLLGIVLFTGYQSGSLADTLHPWVLPNYPEYIHFFKLFIYFSLYSYIGFIRKFLDLASLLPLWDRLFKILGWIAFPFAFTEAILMVTYNFSYFPSDWLNISYAVIFVGFAFGFIISLLLLKGEAKAKYIWTGTLLMCIGVMATVWVRIQDLDYSLFYFQLSSLGEFICFSLGLAFARTKSEEEKQAAAYALTRSKLEQEQQRQETLRQIELNESKSKFYDNLTHEFKTPISVIKSLISLDSFSEENRRMIHKNANNLLGHIQEILDFSKLADNNLPVKLRKFELVEYLNYLVNKFQPWAQMNNQTLRFSSDCQEVYMITDIDHFEKIINNLINNALKFTKENGQIVLLLRVEKDKIILRVKDNGIGISAEHLPKIYDRFYQIDSTANPEGSGIGLALVKELTSLLHGQLEEKSQVNVGTTFQLTFPIQPKGINNKEYELFNPSNDTDQFVEEKIRSNLRFDKTGQQETLLVIEDNEDLIHTYQQLLGEKYHIETAVNGQEGIDKARKLVPDIIICDVAMPKLDGFKVCNLLKRDSGTNHIPIIMITAKSGQKNRIAGYREGVDAFLTKPFDNEELLTHLVRIKDRRLSLQARFKIDALSNKLSPNTLEKEEIFSTEDKFLLSVNRVIENNLKKEKFTSAELSANLFISPKQLRSKFKSSVGYFANEYIRNYRLIKSKHYLLNDPQLQISDIAYEVGFSSSAVYIREFKKLYGITPGEFRRKNNRTT